MKSVYIKYDLFFEKLFYQVCLSNIEKFFLMYYENLVQKGAYLNWTGPDTSYIFVAFENAIYCKLNYKKISFIVYIFNI